MKQTEIGLIPDDWEVIKFGDKVDIFRGGSPRPIERYITTNANGINWIKIGDVRPNDKYIRQTEEKIILEGKSRSREVKKGDFILSNSMSFGRPYILNIDGCIHDGWLTIQNYTECFDKEFLYYLLGSDEVFTQYVQMAAGSSVQNLNKEKVADLQLKVPPLAEQQRIAKALSDVDSLISTTEKLLQKEKNIKQGTMQNLLTGKKRLPGFGDKQTDLFVPNGTHTKEVKDVSPEQIRLSAKMKQTELGEIPEDWEVKSLGDYASIVRGGSPRPIQNFLTTNSDGINWIKIGDVKPEDKYIVSTDEKIIPEGKSRSREVHKGDFILSNSMSFGRPYILQIDGCIHDGWLAIQNYQDTFDTDFLYYLLGSDEIFQQYIEMAAGSSVQNLNKEKVAKLLVPILNKNEQTAIANVLSSMDKEIETLNAKLEKYRNLKTAMMQQLLTGKIRLVK